MIRPKKFRNADLSLARNPEPDIITSQHNLKTTLKISFFMIIKKSVKSKKRNMKKQYGQICRACLQQGRMKDLFSVYKKLHLNLAYLLNYCISVNIDTNDDLPKQICQKCSTLLVKYYKFKCSVMENDVKLRESHTILLQDTNEDETKIEIVKEELSSNNAYACEPNLDNSEIKPNDLNSLNDDKGASENITCDNKKAIKNESNNAENSHQNKNEESINSDEDVPNDMSQSTDSDSDYKLPIKATNKKVGRVKTKNKFPKHHQCDICGKLMKCKSSLGHHMKIHTGERPFSCTVCPKAFLRQEHLKNHERIHTGERPHVCKVCSKTFVQQGALISHMRIHTGERPHLCTVCGKTFAQAVSLIYHMRGHTGETPYKCKICNKGFTQTGNLKIHMRFHTNERPHPCDICGQKFVTRTHLRVHVKQHLGVKAYKCEECGKAFVRNEHLKGHRVTHTGQKPYSCTLCPKKYTQRSHLNRHMKTH